MSVADERVGRPELVDLRDAIVATLTVDGSPVSVIKHRGEWTDESVKQYAVSTPCIAIAVNGGSNWEDLTDGSTQGMVALTAFCITQCLVDGDEDDASLALAGMLLAVVPGNQWGLPKELLTGACDVDFVNAYSHKLDDKGINIYAVSWVHQVTLPKMTAAEYAALPEFLSLFTRAHPGTELDGPMGPQEDMNEVREP